MKPASSLVRASALLIGWGFGPAVAILAAAQDPARPPDAAKLGAADKAGPAPEATDPMVVAIVEAHNKLRADAKLPPLAFAPLLAKAAQVQATDMAGREEMSHEGSDGSTPAERVKRAGYRYLTTGENVAVYYRDVLRVMQAWVESPPHKKNILGDFTELGVAKVEGKDGKAYWCVEFGKPMPKFDPTQAAATFVDRLNDARAGSKRGKLAGNPKLAAAAQAQAAELAKSKGKDGTPTEFTGLDTSRYQELAMSTAVGSPTAEDVLKMFLDNPAYQERLLGPSTQVGVGYATDDDGTPYWCLILGKPTR